MPVIARHDIARRARIRPSAAAFAAFSDVDAPADPGSTGPAMHRARTSETGGELPAGAGLSVVLIDDDDGVRALLRILAHRSDRFEVVGEAREGREGVAVVSEHRPHVVLLDLLMPDLPGQLAAARLRACSPETMVVVLTALDPAGEQAAEALDAGAFTCLRKSVLGPRLMDELARLYDRFVSGEPTDPVPGDDG
ncbi:MAG TPA: response regulator [Candidatus Limnocylindrales bacterium]|nr:response regulator [Candidatus Limnocylindrales bacterium]